MSQSIQYSLENAVSGLLTGISGLNVYKTNRTGKRFFPYATISSSINGQLLGNYTGVYDLNVAVNYSDSASKISQEAFDSQYCAIFEAFYEETPSLQSKIQAELTVGTCYMARIISQNPTIRTEKRAWQRGLVINVLATPIGGTSFLASLNFSDYRNSQYIAVI